MVPATIAPNFMMISVSSVRFVILFATHFYTPALHLEVELSLYVAGTFRGVSVIVLKPVLKKQTKS